MQLTAALRALNIDDIHFAVSHNRTPHEWAEHTVAPAGIHIHFEIILPHPLQPRPYYPYPAVVSVIRWKIGDLPSSLGLPSGHGGPSDELPCRQLDTLGDAGPDRRLPPDARRDTSRSNRDARRRALRDVADDIATRAEPNTC